MRAFHGNREDSKFVTDGQAAHIVGVVVGEEKVAGKTGSGAEKGIVVEFGMRVQSRSGPLAPGGVGRVNERDGIGAVGIILQQAQTVAVNKANFERNRRNGSNAVCQRLRIPARRNPLAVLALLQSPDARRENAAAIDAVAKNGLKCPVKRRPGRSGKFVFDTGRRHRKADNARRQSFIIRPQNCLPDGGHVVVQFRHYDFVGEVLERDGKARNAAPGKRLDKHARL